MVFDLAAIRLCFLSFFLLLFFFVSSVFPLMDEAKEACVNFLMGGGTGMGKPGSCFGGQGLAQ